MRKSRLFLIIIAFISLLFGGSLGYASWIYNDGQTVYSINEKSKTGSAEESTPIAYYGTNYFASIDAAVRSANNTGTTQTVYVIPGVTTSITKDLTINSNVTLCLPYEGTTWDYGDPTKTGLSDSFIDSSANNVKSYRKTQVKVINSTITINSGANLYVGGKFRAKGICGLYTEITLDENSKIRISGTMYNYGYVKELNGINAFQSQFDNTNVKYNNEIDPNRYIEVLNGGTFKAALACYNSLGASYLTGLNDKNICPLDTFDLPNTQTYVKINVGGTLQAQAKIYVTSSLADKAVNETVTLVTSSSIASSKNLKPLFYLDSGYISFENCPTDVLYSNVNSKTIISTHGTVSVGYLYIDLSVATIDTSNMFLPLSYKLITVLGSDTVFTCNYDVKFLAGSKLRIENGVTANINKSFIFYKSGSMSGLSTTYPENLDDATCINNGSLILGANSYLGGHFSTEAEDNSAMIDTTKVTLAKLTATAYEGTTKTPVSVQSTGDFYDEDEDAIVSRLLDGGQTILSRDDGKKCWASGFVDSYTLTIKVVNANNYSYPASGFKVYSYNSSGGNESLMSSEGKFELDLGEYSYYLKRNEQFKVTSLPRNYSSTFTQQSGSDYTFTSDQKYSVKGNIELTIVAGDGYEIWFTSSSASGNSGSSKVIYECNTSSGTFQTLKTGGAGGDPEKLVIGKNQYFKCKYIQGEGYASFRGYYKISGHNSATNSINGWTKVGSGEISDPVLCDAEYTLLSYLSGCIDGDTLVTMGDGSIKMLKNIVSGEEVLTYNFFTGKYEIKPACAIVNHGFDNNLVIKATFDDGSELRMINEHGLYDYDLKQLVSFNSTTGKEYIGHRFVTENNGKISCITLVDLVYENTYCESWSIFTSDNLNAVTNGLLSTNSALPLTHLISDLNEDFMYDSEYIQELIDLYGYSDYSEWQEYINEYLYYSFNFKMINLYFGNGVTTKNEIIWWIDFFYYLLEEGCVF